MKNNILKRYDIFQIKKIKIKAVNIEKKYNFVIFRPTSMKLAGSLDLNNFYSFGTIAMINTCSYKC